MDYRELFQVYLRIFEEIDELLVESEPAHVLASDRANVVKLIEKLRKAAADPDQVQKSYPGVPFPSRAVADAMAELDKTFQSTIKRSGIPIDWEEHLDRVRSVVGPWPPGTRSRGFD